jgi:hypothetical protein
MIAIESNIGGVLRQAQQFEALVPAALIASVEKDRWLQPARLAAQVALNVLARSESERALIPFFVAAVETHTLSPVGLRIAMEAPTSESDASLAEGFMDKARSVEAARHRPGPRTSEGWDQGAEMTATMLNEALLEWVQSFKRLDPDEEHVVAEGNAQTIVNRLRYMLSGRSSAADANVDRLARAIDHYLQEIWWPAWFGSDEPYPKTAGWLEAVLAAWRALILTQWPSVMKQDIKKAWAKSQTQLGV